MNADQLTSQGLREALAWTPNLAPHVHAAVHLVLSDRYWLDQTPFRDAVDVEVFAGLVVATVDWNALAARVDGLDAPRERVAVLRLACWIAAPTPPGAGPAWSLQGLLGDLDRDGTRAAISAFAMATVGRNI